MGCQAAAMPQTSAQWPCLHPLCSSQPGTPLTLAQQPESTLSRNPLCANQPTSQAPPPSPARKPQQAPTGIRAPGCAKGHVVAQDVAVEVAHVALLLGSLRLLHLLPARRHRRGKEGAVGSARGDAAAGRQGAPPGAALHCGGGGAAPPTSLGKVGVPTQHHASPHHITPWRTTPERRPPTWKARMCALSRACLPARLCLAPLGVLLQLGSVGGRHKALLLPKQVVLRLALLGQAALVLDVCLQLALLGLVCSRPGVEG
jgi:hypothetical protein